MLGAISAPMVRRWQTNKKNNNNKEGLRRVDAADLTQAAIITVQRTQASHTESRRYLRMLLPVMPAVLRLLLDEMCQSAEEHDTIARMELVKGITCFSITVQDTRLSVRTRPIRCVPSRAGCTWCTWVADVDEPQYQFWSSLPTMDITRFALEQAPSTAENTIRYEFARAPLLLAGTHHHHTNKKDEDEDDEDKASSSSSWTQGSISWGPGAGIEFYRV